MNGVFIMKIEEIDIPNNWHTAAECRQRADNWVNSELKTCAKIVLDNLWKAAGEGQTHLSHDILTNRPKYFYEMLKNLMVSLGYRVEMPENPSDTRYGRKTWDFYW